MTIWAPPTIGGPIVGSTSGSVLYADSNSNFAQDNANLFWDGSNHRLGIGTAAPSYPLHLVASITSVTNVGPNSDKPGMFLEVDSALTSDVSGSGKMQVAQYNINYSSNFNIPTIRGLELDCQATNSSGVITNLEGLYLFCANGSGNTTNVKSFRAGFQGTSTGVVTNRYGAYIEEAVLSGGATITNNYGVYVDTIAAGSTLNYAFFANGGISQIPTVVGGSGVSSPLTLRSTTGVGTTGADIIFQTGTNGATEAMRLTNAGALTIRNSLTVSGTGADSAINLSATLTGSGTTQRGIVMGNLTVTSSATVGVDGLYVGITTPNVSFTTPDVACMNFGGISKGAAHTITRAWGGCFPHVTSGTNNVDCYVGGGPAASTTFTGNYGIFQGQSVQNRFAGNLGLGLDPTHVLQLSTDDAAKPTTNTWTVTSDRRTKNQIRPFTVGSEILRKLEAKTFVYNGLAGTEQGAVGVGFIAQDMVKHAPEMFPRHRTKIDINDTQETDVYQYVGHNFPFMLLNGWQDHDSRLATIEKQLGII